jgi:hypothetical protein
MFIDIDIEKLFDPGGIVCFDGKILDYFLKITDVALGNLHRYFRFNRDSFMANVEPPGCSVDSYNIKVGPERFDFDV